MGFVTLLWFNFSLSSCPSVKLSVVSDQTHFKAAICNLCLCSERSRQNPQLVSHLGEVYFIIPVSQKGIYRVQL